MQKIFRLLLLSLCFICSHVSFGMNSYFRNNGPYNNNRRYITTRKEVWTFPNLPAGINWYNFSNYRSQSNRALPLEKTEAIQQARDRLQEIYQSADSSSNEKVDLLNKLVLSSLIDASESSPKYLAITGKNTTDLASSTNPEEAFSSLKDEENIVLCTITGKDTEDREYQCVPHHLLNETLAIQKAKQKLQTLHPSTVEPYSQESVKTIIDSASESNPKYLAILNTGNIFDLDSLKEQVDLHSNLIDPFDRKDISEVITCKITSPTDIEYRYIPKQKLDDTITRNTGFILGIASEKEDDAKKASDYLKQAKLSPHVEVENTDALMIASEHGSLNIMEWLINTHKLNPNKPSSDQTNALHHATMNEKHAAMRLLLKHGADPTLADAYDHPPLYFAIHNRDLTAVEILGRHTPNVLTSPYVENGTSTPLHHSVEVCDFFISQYLTEHDASDNIKNEEGKIALQIAFERYQLKSSLLTRMFTLEVMLTPGTAAEYEQLLKLFHFRSIINRVKSQEPINFEIECKQHPTLLSDRDSQGNHLLNLSMMANNKNAVKQLLSKADKDMIFTPNQAGLTPEGVALSLARTDMATLTNQYALTVAAKEGLDDEVRKLLKDKKVDPNTIVDENGISPLEHAYLNRHFGIAEELVDHNANPNITLGKKKQGLLLRAVVFTELGLARKLIKKKVDPNTSDTEGLTPLNAAVRKRSLDMLKLLIEEANADLNSLDNGVRSRVNDPEIKTYLDAQYKMKQLFEDLSQYNNAVGRIVGLEEDQAGEYLHYAVRTDDASAVESILKEHDAKYVLSKDSGGRIPFTVAKEHNNQDLINLLATPTMKAAIEEGNTDLVTDVLELATINLNDTDILSHAGRNKKYKIAMDLIEHGASIDTRIDEQRRTLVMQAVIDSEFSTVEELITNNADVNVRDGHGLTTLNYSNSHLMTQLLTDNGAILPTRTSNLEPPTPNSSYKLYIVAGGALTAATVATYIVHKRGMLDNLFTKKR